MFYILVFQSNKYRWLVSKRLATDTPSHRHTLLLSLVIVLLPYLGQV